MKINLDKLRAAGWNVLIAANESEVTLNAPAMDQAGYEMIRKVITTQVHTPMGIDLVMGGFFDSLEKAALIESLE